MLEAVYNGHLLCVELLINRGADVTAFTNKQRTVLHHAAYTSHGQIMKFLLENVVGPQAPWLVNIQDFDGNTALHDCCQGPVAALKIARMLLQASAIIDIKNKKG